MNSKLKRRRLFAAALLLGLAAGCNQESDAILWGQDAPAPAVAAPESRWPLARWPNYDAYYDRSAVLASRLERLTAPVDRPGHIASRDALREVPAVLWTPPTAVPEAVAASGVAAAARWHLERYAPLYKLGEAALNAAEVARVHDTGRGALIVEFRQRVGDIEVYRDALNVVMKRDYSLVGITGNLSLQAAGAATKAAAFAMSPDRAFELAVASLYGEVPRTSALTQRAAAADAYQRFEFAEPLQVRGVAHRLHQPARVKRVYYPLPDRLVPAYFVELDVAVEDREPGDTYLMVLAADDGRLLARHNRNFADSFRYTVFADAAAPHTPSDGPIQDVTPHPAGMPNGLVPGFVPPVVVSMQGFNKNADPWLPPGATVTTGNNVEAYADHYTPPQAPGGPPPPNRYDEGHDTRADTTAANTFHYVYDPTLDPMANANQIKAAVVQLFYDINWLHDYYYDSGFDEAAGNAQTSNYGRGGEEGDALQAQAQDSGGRNFNNANMSTPHDGAPPRMQMYLWLGRIDKTKTAGRDELVVTDPPPTRPYAVGRAAFFPPESETATTVSGQVLLVSDNMGTPTDGCESITTDLTGRIALIDRGNCTFVQKTLNAQAQGAVGVIIANNDTASPDSPITLGGVSWDVTIIAVGVSYNTGVTLKGELAAGLTATISRAGVVRDVRRDATIDNHIVAHEWGHYFHHRLALCGAPSFTQCPGESEGWGDYLALHMMIRPGDNLDGTYGVSTYATHVIDDNTYYGIRRVPYSVDFAKNALTFKHIEDNVPLPAGIEPGRNSEVHNAGEIWATMLHEAYVALLKQTQGASPRLTFAQAQRRMTDYVVAGLKLAPVDATFTEQRDGILMAALAADRADFDLMAAAFARRGAGTGAVSPERMTPGNPGVVESFVVRGALRAAAMGFADQDAANCDADNVLDAGETGTVTVTVMNVGAHDLGGTTVTISSTMADVSFPAGNSVTVPPLAPFATADATFSVQLAPTFASSGDAALDLDFTLSNPDAIATSVHADFQRRINYDNVPATSATDTAESDLVVWTETTGAGIKPVPVWDRVTTPPDQSPTTHSFRGTNPGTRADQSFESPDLVLDGASDFGVTFKHRYSFEADDVLFDGGVIELSTDGGQTWNDVTQYNNVDPGYDGILAKNRPDVENPLYNRMGFGASSAAFPAFENVTLNFGTALGTNTVRLRFRIGADRGTGDYGWEIDDIAFAGITNTPFPTIVAEPDVCIIDSPPKSPGGCGCRVGATSAPGQIAGTLLLGLGVLFGLRRRRRSRSM